MVISHERSGDRWRRVLCSRCRLARAHILALDNLDKSSAVYNLGCGGTGYSVKEVIDIAREVTGKEIPVKVGPRRPGDPAVLVASSEKIKKEVGWLPQFQELRLIVESAWSFIQPQEKDDTVSKEELNLSATEPGQYEVNCEGRLLFDGQLTAWEMHDLLDTGRMATPNLTAVLLDGSTAEGDNVREQNL